MSSSTIDSVLYIGQKSLRSITNNYKNEALWMMQDVINKDTTYIALNKSSILEPDQYDLFFNSPVRPGFTYVRTEQAISASSLSWLSFAARSSSVIFI